MNDFTREELILIKNGIQYLSDRTSLSDGYLEKCNDVENKIQSMIDNYCDHEIMIEYTLHTHLNDLFEGKEDKVFLCKKCNRYFL